MTERDLDVEFKENVPQERVQDNENWGEENLSADERRPEYWSDVTDENAEDGAGLPTGGGED
ncbi:hypothetical protein [Deinococcus sonorensis]|uniref:Uncharacterized protein n=2 Tax=Deinococcus sonorensis TaxID=309891 RepID=A0AAU7UBD2_9DEIO